MNLFELFVKIGVDDQASSKLETITGKIGNGLKTAAKIGTAAVTAASTAVVALTKNAVENYAEYEQLVGGVETLFSGTKKSFAELYDEMSAQGKSVDEIHAKWKEYQQGVYTVTENAANAFRTAGLSSNEYMSTVTSFSASLLQSLGGDTVKAAEYAHIAVTDMSDNANKMGKILLI